MTEVTFYCNTDHKIIAFDCEGHAGYKRFGKDIVCSAISVLTINTINTLTDILNIQADINTDSKSGIINFRLLEKPTNETELILRSYELGVNGIANEYGSKYCLVTTKED